MTTRPARRLPLAALLLFGAGGCATSGPPPIIDVDDTFGTRPEPERLRYFREIDADEALGRSGLTGAGVNVTIMGEMVDAGHPDLTGAVGTQYNTWRERGVVLSGEEHMPVGADRLGPNDGHGTHIAGTLAASCDGAGLQGLACGARVDVYDLGTYDDPERYTTTGWGEVDELERLIVAFGAALDDVAARGSSRIVTGSFNLESPAIAYEVSGPLAGLSITGMIDRLEPVRSVDELFDSGLATPVDAADRPFLKTMVDRHDDGDIAAMSLLPLTSTWRALEDAIARYQAGDGVYLVTESNYVFDDRTSTLNAMPSLGDEVDPALWLSVVMAVPEGLDTLDESSTEEDVNRLMEGPYINPINSCGKLAADYCIMAPSYNVLSTMTERVAFELGGGSPLYSLDDRLYQSLSGHSMGAPMVAATLALMEEENRRLERGYDMRDLVRILKQSASRDFPGYDRERHGVGLLNVGAAIDAL